MTTTTTDGAITSAERSTIFSLAVRKVPFDVIVLLMGGEELSGRKRADIADEYTRAQKSIAAGEDYRNAAAEKALWMMSVYRQMARQESLTTIPEVHSLDVTSFETDFYFRNRPVVLRGFGPQWQSFDRWHLPRLLEDFRDEQIEIMSNRDEHDDYDVDVEKTRTLVTVARFGEMLHDARNRETNDFYLAARNLALRKTFRPLVSTLSPLPGLLKPHDASSLNLWVGPAGTNTKLHHDLTNVLFLQLWGSKQMWFVPPYETQLVYNKTGVVAEADAARPDFKKHPLFAAATISTTVVNQGDAIFIPVGWWHQVRSLSESVSLSFINFVHENLFHIGEFPHSHSL